MNGWVLTSERKPTADDADENGRVWVMSGSIVAVVAHEAVGTWECTSAVWHPKPKAQKPEPCVPPVPERFYKWLIVDSWGHVTTSRSCEQSARAAMSAGERLVRVREVRDGDPSPEDVASVLVELGEIYRHTAYPQTIKKCIKLLGGKP